MDNWEQAPSWYAADLCEELTLLLEEAPMNVITDAEHTLENLLDRIKEEIG